MVKIKRVYEPAEDSDGLRVLVDKFWPRGMKKADLSYDLWIKTIGPSDNLRKMFHENPEKHWHFFSEQYTKELEQSGEFLAFVSKLKDMNPATITLLYAFKNAEKNHAYVLKETLEKHLLD